MPVTSPAHIREQQINSKPNISFVRWDSGFHSINSKAVVRCSIDGFEWVATATSLLTTGTGCPQCSGKRRWTAEERIEHINSLPNIEFVRWADEYRNKNSKAVVRCAVDGFEWSPSVASLINGGRRCPQCSKQRHWTAEERIEQINAKPNISFVRWELRYKGANSKAVCRCGVDGFEWPARVSNLLKLKGTGCPKCAEHGYNQEKPGTLYVLRSECGSMVKIGISNNYKQRHSQLRRRTPFNWHCIELLHGDGVTIAEWEKELHSWTQPVEFRESFEGHTEWRKWDDRLPQWVKRPRARLERYNKAP